MPQRPELAAYHISLDGLLGGWHWDVTHRATSYDVNESEQTT
jgi:hypothetical protein